MSTISRNIAVLAFTAIAAFLWISQTPAAGAYLAQDTELYQHDHGFSPANPAPMQAMMDMREAMMARMKAADEEIGRLVQNMNSATGDAKIAAMAELLGVLADRHRRDRESMMAMQNQMMSHMMGHMNQMGGRMMMAAPPASK
jgi:hypothetical protein